MGNLIVATDGTGNSGHSRGCHRAALLYGSRLSALSPASLCHPKRMGVTVNSQMTSPPTGKAPTPRSGTSCCSSTAPSPSSVPPGDPKSAYQPGCFVSRMFFEALRVPNCNRNNKKRSSLICFVCAGVLMLGIGVVVQGGGGGCERGPRGDTRPGGGGEGGGRPCRACRESADKQTPRF